MTFRVLWEEFEDRQQDVPEGFSALTAADDREARAVDFRTPGDI